MRETTFDQRLSALRARMQEQGIDAFLLPVTDEYQGEYSPACARRVTWLSGFDGSAGILAVLADKAALFVDGRYTLQASLEVDSRLYAVYNSADKTSGEYLGASLPEGAVAGYDPMLHTLCQIETLEKKTRRRAILFRPLTANPVDLIWQGRPDEPTEAVFLHPIAYAGKPSAEKREEVAASLNEAGLDACILSMPDSIAWLLNIRGGDIPYNPLPLCYAVLHADATVDLFIHPGKLSAHVRAELEKDAILHPPGEMERHLLALGHAKKRVGYDPAATAVRFEHMLRQGGAAVEHFTDPCALPKAKKNKAEIDGMQEAHLHDGVALVKFLRWFDTLPVEEHITELDVVDKLAAFREEYAGYRGPSFATIAGCGPNGAIVHYRADAKSSRVIAPGDVLLLDSGGQYPGGTTDITRTLVCGGHASLQFCEHFTRVLKGHIALATARFPKGTTGGQLDALARRPLWEAGLDYDHGTGHGVGSYLCVHEGPQRIGKRGGDAALEPGMILSNEPGYYREGEYGIRIENLVLVEQGEEGENKEFLAFRTLTLAPVDPRLVDMALLRQAEKQWLKSYHARVIAVLAPYLDMQEREWLEGYCAV